MNYVSIFDDVISKKDGLIDEYYLNDNKYDHHLSASNVQIFGSRNLNEFLICCPINPKINLIFRL